MMAPPPGIAEQIIPDNRPFLDISTKITGFFEEREQLFHPFRSTLSSTESGGRTKMTQATQTTGTDLDDYALMDRYTRRTGRVLLTGTQALVRILLDQRDRDRADAINSAGFVSGYRGSPLGGVDLELWRARKFLTERRIEFLPAVNEDLAATAVLGSQQVETNPTREVDGVFGLWYGKGPGVDRSGDALKHGNAYGSSPHGGVLALMGDDHMSESSTTAHQ